MQAYEKLEIAFGEFVENENVVVCSSGSAALHLAMETLRAVCGKKDYDACVIPSLTMVSCYRAVELAGYGVGLSDVDNVNGLIPQIEPGSFETTVMPVHLYGRQAPTAHPGLTVIEDMAEAPGLKPNPNSFAACWSFYRNKIIAGEEGGAVAFKDSLSASVARRLRCCGFDDAHTFDHMPRGMNYRMSNVHAELIYGSLARYPYNIERRREVEAMYDDHMPKHVVLGKRDQPWVYDIHVGSKKAAGAVAYLKQNGVEARHYFKPMDQQGWFPGDRKKCRVSSMLHSSRLYLPIDPEMTESEVKLSSRLVTEFCESVDVPA